MSKKIDTSPSANPRRPGPFLSELEWELRHGTRAIKEGALQAKTDTDYLTFACPDCKATHKGGCGLALQGILRDDEGQHVAVSFAFHCLKCGFRDYFKIPTDHGNRYGTGEPVDPSKWPRRGRPSMRARP